MQALPVITVSMRFVLDHPWLLAVVAVVLQALAAAVGVAVAPRRKEARDALTPVQAGVLGLAGLLLGFSFSMSLSRFEERRALVVQEANAIGTTQLRAGLLSRDLAEAAAPLLARYVDARLVVFDPGADEAAAARASSEAVRLQSGLWRIAEQAAAVAPTPVTASFIVTLNEMIDLEASRDEAARNRLPGVVWFALLVVTLGSSLLTSELGLALSRGPLATLAVVFAVVLGLIAELDTPRAGWLQVSEYPMQRLHQGLIGPAP